MDTTRRSAGEELEEEHVDSYQRLQPKPLLGEVGYGMSSIASTKPASNVDSARYDIVALVLGMNNFSGMFVMQFCF